MSIEAAKKMIQCHSFPIDIDNITFPAIADGDFFNINIRIVFF